MKSSSAASAVTLFWMLKVPTPRCCSDPLGQPTWRVHVQILRAATVATLHLCTWKLRKVKISEGNMWNENIDCQRKNKSYYHCITLYYHTCLDSSVNMVNQFRAAIPLGYAFAPGVIRTKRHNPACHRITEWK